MKTRPVICLTPVYNEAPRLNRFLEAASLWADHIIIADQMSDDGSREIAESFSKVILIENTSTKLDEKYRRDLLVSAARQISADAVHVGLDSDEFLTGNFKSEPEWEAFKKAPQGTVAFFNWLQVSPCLTRAWDSETLSFAYIDNGIDKEGRQSFHDPRVPIVASREIFLNRVGVLHYHYVDWEDMMAKIRFYQCNECVIRNQFTAIDLYRFYNKWRLLQSASRPMPPEWLDFYRINGVDMTSFAPANPEKWYKKTVGLMEEYGVEAFKNAHVWGIDWTAVAKRNGFSHPERFGDPRSITTKALHSYLRRTQHLKETGWVRRLDDVFKKFGF